MKNKAVIPFIYYIASASCLVVTSFLLFTKGFSVYTLIFFLFTYLFRVCGKNTETIFNLQRTLTAYHENHKTYVDKYKLTILKLQSELKELKEL